MNWLWRGMAILIEYPVLAAAIGLVLFGVGQWLRRRLVMRVGIV